MRLVLFRIFSFFAIFIFAQAAVLPWVISNNYLPLWLDIALISFVIVVWLAIIDRFVYHFIRLLKKKDELLD
jgi:hypothetical protein